MTQTFFNKNGVISLEAISKEEDLRPAERFRFFINPPPQDGRCDVCGRHLSELTPYGGPGDPLVGDFSGELLVKTFRADWPEDEEAEKAWKEAEKSMKVLGPDDTLPWFIAKYGEEKGTKFYWSGQNSVGASWECRDCIVLEDDEYFEKRNQRYQEDRNE